MQRATFLIASLIALSGCSQHMARQPKMKPMRMSEFFADGRSGRPIVPGTVARGQLKRNVHIVSSPDKREGMEKYVDELPVKVDRALLERGRERFNIFCSVCHDRTGTGRGAIVRRGYFNPPSYHIDRLRKAPVGYFYEVMTNGFGAMPDYAAQIPPPDRWAIAAYVRALQISQNASLQDVPREERERLASNTQ